MLPEKINKEKKGIELLFENSIIDVKKEVIKPPTILSIKEGINTDIYRRIFSLGNFSCITGKAKAKKTYLLTMFASAILKGDAGKLVGTLLENKKKIIYIDTEQGNYDSYNTMKRIIKMAGTEENFTGLNLRPYTYRQRCEIIEEVFIQWGKDIAYCVIDGVADLASGINDEEEATRVSSMLLRLTFDNNCHISTVLHQNKNDNYATGHLGSSVMKKSEMVISVTKDKTDKWLSIIQCDYSRSIDFESFLMSVNMEGLPEIYNGKRPEKEEKNFYEKDDIDFESKNEAPF